MILYQWIHEFKPKFFDFMISAILIDMMFWIFFFLNFLKNTFSRGEIWRFDFFWYFCKKSSKMKIVYHWMFLKGKDFRRLFWCVRRKKQPVEKYSEIFLHKFTGDFFFYRTNFFFVRVFFWRIFFGVLSENFKFSRKIWRI